jgi:hypothetical protein
MSARAFVSLVLSGLFLLSPRPGVADTAAERQTLIGLTGVRVVVEEIRPDAARDGLLKTALQTAVEFKLRLAGIRVLTDIEWSQRPGTPVLYVNVQTTKMTDKTYVFRSAVSLHQGVRLIREPTVVVQAATWTTGYIGSIATSNLRTVQDRVADQTDDFINAYLAVNGTAR